MNRNTLATKLRIGTPPAPGDLVLVEGFLNTWSGELGIDDFKTARSTEEWLRSVGLWTGAKKITSAEAQGIAQFRAELRAWIRNKERNGPLNELLRQVNFKAEFGPKGAVQFHPAGSAYHRALGTLTGVIAQSMQNGTWDRLKCCDLETCGWAYYDATRSRTKRWCSMKTCGSRHKAREYYKRNRKA